MLFLLLVLVYVTVAVSKRDNAFVKDAYVVEYHPDAPGLETYNATYRIRHSFQTMNALSLSFDLPQDATHFFQVAKPSIKQVWPVSSVSKPNVIQTTVQNEWSPHLFDFYDIVGINRIRDELGLYGRGIKVGIIDTGVDYTHPALGGCFGPGCRVAFGHDFTGDAYTGANDPEPDDDPLDLCNGHGTHVAGIIGANDTKRGFTGVAPDVTFGVYRVFGCRGSSADDLIMKAMEQAYLDGMDVINMSLGDVGWPASPASLLADQLAQKGMIVCAAAGNEGEKGIFEVGAPSLGQHVISVASVDNTQTLAHTIQVGDTLVGYTTGKGKAFKFSEAEIVPVSDVFPAHEDACRPILSAHLLGKVALVARGGCFFAEKLKNVQSAGAIAMLVYNDNSGMVTPSVTDSFVHIEHGGVTKYDGQLLFEYSKKSPGYTFRFLEKDTSYKIPTAGTISSFSSWGLGPDLSIKPDLSAPGGEIYSTFPLELGGYATLSGTSMASPFVAGIVALLQQARGGNRSIAVDELRTKLINNGRPFNVYGSDMLDSVARQGSGLVNVYQALRSETILEPQQIRLNDPAHAATANEYSFTIHNYGRMAAEYAISHKTSVIVQGYDVSNGDGNIKPLSSPVLFDNQTLNTQQISISPEVLIIPANDAATVTVHVEPPLQPANVPPTIYSGYFVITRNNDASQTLHLPYAGLTSDLMNLPVLNINTTMPTVILTETSVTHLSPALLRFQLIEPSPLIIVSVVNASDPEQSFGIIPGGYLTYAGRNDLKDVKDTMDFAWFGNVATTADQAMAHNMATADLSSNWPSLLLRGSHFSSDDFSAGSKAGDIAETGEYLPSATYRLKVKALHAFGNVENDNDYDIWVSEPIQLE